MGCSSWGSATQHQQRAAFDIQAFRSPAAAPSYSCHVRLTMLLTECLLLLYFVCQFVCCYSVNHQVMQKTMRMAQLAMRTAWMA
jgi:hypothetical protein